MTQNGEQTLYMLSSQQTEKIFSERQQCPPSPDPKKVISVQQSPANPPVLASERQDLHPLEVFCSSNQETSLEPDTSTESKNTASEGAEEETMNSEYNVYERFKPMLL